MIESEATFASRIDLDRRIELASSGYYGLPLDARIHAYATIGRLGYFRNKGILETFQAQRGYFPFVVDEKILTEELSEIVPAFGGRVVGRRFEPEGVLHYIVDSKGLADIFPNETNYATFTGKVISEDDKVLGPKYQDLAGLVIVQAKMRTPDAENFKALHELNHVTYSLFPNAKRRETLKKRLSEVRDPKERVNTLIDLERAILIDEAAACLGPYTDQRCNPIAFKNNYAREVKDAAGDLTGVMLAQIKGNTGIDDWTISRIKKHERDFINFPFEVQLSVENLAFELRNPKRLESYGNAISYVREALQVLDFNEIPRFVEPFCSKILEPNRL